MRRRSSRTGRGLAKKNLNHAAVPLLTDGTPTSESGVFSTMEMPSGRSRFFRTGLALRCLQNLCGFDQLPLPTIVMSSMENFNLESGLSTPYVPGGLPRWNSKSGREPRSSELSQYERPQQCGSRLSGLSFRCSAQVEESPRRSKMMTVLCGAACLFVGYHGTTFLVGNNVRRMREEQGFRAPRLLPGDSEVAGCRPPTLLRPGNGILRRLLSRLGMPLRACARRTTRAPSRRPCTLAALRGFALFWSPRVGL